jgi:hypothetical protein
MIRIVNRYRLEPEIRDEVLSRIREIEVMFGEQLESYRPSAVLTRSIRRLTEKNQLLIAQLLTGSRFLDKYPVPLSSFQYERAYSSGSHAHLSRS